MVSPLPVKAPPAVPPKVVLTKARPKTKAAPKAAEQASASSSSISNKRVAEVEAEEEEYLPEIDPTIRIDFSGTQVEIVDPDTCRLVGLTRQSIAQYHYVVSLDFHNVLDLDSRGRHVPWNTNYPTCPEEVQRFLVRLSKFLNRTNGLCIVTSYCHAIDTKRHVIRTVSNTVESLSGELGINCVAFIVLTRYPTRRGGKGDILTRIGEQPPGLPAKWRIPVLHLDDSNEIIDSLAGLDKVEGLFIRSQWKKPHRRPAPPINPCASFDFVAESYDYIRQWVIRNYPDSFDYDQIA